MKKNIYAIYDVKAGGVTGDLFTDFNDETVKRGFQEQQKKQPLSKNVATDYILVRLGYIDYQCDLVDVKINSKTEIVAPFTEFLTFVDNELSS